jgi:hypothetical protein
MRKQCVGQDGNSDTLVRNRETVMPTMKVVVNRSVGSDLCELALLQASALVDARRECLMVTDTGKDGETVVLFKLMERQRQVGFQIALNRLNSATAGNPNEWIPLHSSRIQMRPAYEEQIRVGLRMMKKIARAIGEASSQTLFGSQQQCLQKGISNKHETRE